MGGNQDRMIEALKKGKVVECEECGTENAMWHCTECEQSLCAMCEVDLHKKGARIRHTRTPLNAKALRSKNMSISATTNDIDCKETEVVQDGRIECKFCNRKFNPDRVEKHMRICNASKKKNKRKRIYDGAAKRIEDTDFAQYQYNRAKTPEIVKEWKKNGRRRKQESCQLRQIANVNDDSEYSKQIRKKNAERKDEEPDIVIKAPAHKPVFKKSVSSSPSISGISNGNKKKFPSMKGSRLRMGARSASNRSSNSSSSKSSARGYVSKFERKQSAKKSRNEIKSAAPAKNRVSSRRASNKKPGIPKFS